MAKLNALQPYKQELQKANEIVTNHVQNSANFENVNNMMNIKGGKNRYNV
jgi:hypothetical protein